MKENFKLSSVSFFCPAYNDAGNLPDLIPVAHDFLRKNSDRFEIVIIDDVKLENWKTKEMAKIINGISKIFSSKYGSLLFITDKKYTDTLERTSRNLPKVDVMEAKNLNALNLMARKNLVLMKEAVEVITKTFS